MRVHGPPSSLPVAGTAVADGDEASLRALTDSVKDQREHRFVVDAIIETLSEYCDELDVGALPEVAVFGHVAHLATRDPLVLFPRGMDVDQIRTSAIGPMTALGVKGFWLFVAGALFCSMAAGLEVVTGPHEPH